MSADTVNNFYTPPQPQRNNFRDRTTPEHHAFNRMVAMLHAEHRAFAKLPTDNSDTLPFTEASRFLTIYDRLKASPTFQQFSDEYCVDPVAATMLFFAGEIYAAKEKNQ